jgi:hypothetical protein
MSIGELFYKPLTLSVENRISSFKLLLTIDCLDDDVDDSSIVTDRVRVPIIDTSSWFEIGSLR